MDYVVDIQGFRSAYKEFLPKEVTVATLDHRYFAHWIIEPPYAFSELDENARIANNYVTCYHHGIDWFDGDISLKKLYKNLQEIAGSAYRILTRGHEKAKFLEAVTSRRIINLEHSGCPPFAKLEPAREYCFFHGVKKEEFYTCSLNNAVKLKKWLAKSKLLQPYDYPGHADLIRGKCELDHKHPTLNNGHISKEERPPTPPERIASKQTVPAELPTPPLTPTKPERHVKKSEEPTTPVPDVDSDQADPLDLSSKSGSYTTAESLPYGISISEDEQDEQPSNSRRDVAVISEQRKPSFSVRPGSPGVDTANSCCLKHR